MAQVKDEKEVGQEIDESNPDAQLAKRSDGERSGVKDERKEAEDRLKIGKARRNDRETLKAT